MVSSSRIEDVVERWCSSILTDDRFTHLPPTLGDDEPMPIASMYVELRVAAGARPSRRHDLVPTFSIAQEQQELYRQRRAQRITVEEAFGGSSGPLHAVVLGDPGGGKTSMLKRMAFDIASGGMPRWRVPLFASLANWWRSSTNAATNAPKADLLAYCCEDVLSRVLDSGSFESGASVPLGPATTARSDEAHALATHLRGRAGRGRGDVLLLLDGFDEIATESRAVEVVLGTLRELSPQLSWLMTSRRAGFDGRIPAQSRYELAELDSEGMEALITNWFSHRPSLADPKGLMRSIAPGTSIRQLAHNPFLLSLLCRIHQDSDSADALPTTRVGVYREIFKLARERIRAVAARSLDSTGVTRSLSQEPGSDFARALERRLARFCYWLYSNASYAPRQLFDRDDWLDFLECEDPEMRDDAASIDTCLHRARLLDRWGERGDYHVVHSTIHEFLVAQHVVAACPLELVHRRNQPAWREILRFGSGLSWWQGQKEIVGKLLHELLDPPDLNGVRFIEVARILADLSVKDTTSTLGFDLRDRLWNTWSKETPYLSQAAADALALLDPEWAVARALAVIHGEEKLVIEGESTRLDGLLTAAIETKTTRNDPRHAAIQLLGIMATRSAEDALVVLLEGRNEDRLASRAAGVLASMDRPGLRERLRAWAAHPSRTVEHELLATLIARKDVDRGWVPWLLGLLASSEPSLRAGALNAVIALRDPRATDPLIEHVEALPSPTSDPLSLEALANIRGERARIWLRALWAGAFEDRAGTDPDELGELAYHLVAQRTLNDEELASIIQRIGSDPDTMRLLPPLLDGIQDRTGDDDTSTSNALVEAIRGCLLGPFGDRAARALCALAAQQGEDSGLLALAVDALQHSDSYVRAGAATALGAAGSRGLHAAKRAAPKLRVLAKDPNESSEVRLAAVEALGMWSEPDPTTLDLFEALMLDIANVDLCSSAAEALGNLDPARLGRWRDKSHVVHALSKVAAERALLMFEHGYIDPSGELHAWKETASPGTPLFLAQATRTLCLGEASTVLTQAIADTLVCLVEHHGTYVTADVLDAVAVKSPRADQQAVAVMARVKGRMTSIRKAFKNLRSTGTGFDEPIEYEPRKGYRLNPLIIAMLRD